MFGRVKQTAAGCRLQSSTPATSRVILAGFYPPPFGGEAIHVKQLAEFLRQHGMQVELLNLNKNASPSPAYRCAFGRLARLRMLFSLPDQSAILHLHAIGHNWQSWTLILVAALTARWKGLLCALTVHSGLFPGYVGRFGWMRRLLATWILRSFTRVVCVNHQIHTALQDLNIASSRCVLIPAFLGVGTASALTHSDRLLALRFNPLIVAVGGGDSDPELGLPPVVEACKDLLQEMPRLGLILLGWRVGRRMRPLIEGMRLSEHVVCLGEVPHERCLSLLQAATVVVRSTFADGDSITVRESQGLGVPVVASDTDFRPEGVVIFRKGDARDLLQKLRDVITRSGSRRPATVTYPDYSGEMLWRMYLDLANRAEMFPAGICATQSPEEDRKSHRDRGVRDPIVIE